MKSLIALYYSRYSINKKKERGIRKEGKKRKEREDDLFVGKNHDGKRCLSLTSLEADSLEAYIIVHNNI